MTTAAIVKILVDNVGNVELSRQDKRRIISRNLECIWSDAKLDEALADVKRLDAQRTELSTLLPDNAELHASQFDDAVRKVAESIQEAIELHP